MPSTNLDSSQTRFFIALILPQNVQNYANQLIQELGDRYRTRASKAPPHITLQPPFLWHLETISEVESSLSKFVQIQSAVPIQLSGFGAFAPRVLFINVLKTPELLNCQTNLMAHLAKELEIIDPVSQNRPFSPHVTIASRNLTRHTFKQIHAELQERQAEFEFICDRLTLLIHNGQRWQPHAEFPFRQASAGS